MSNTFGALDGVISLGQVGAVPTGPRGVGIRDVAYADNGLRITLTDGQAVDVPMPIGGGMGDGSEGSIGDPNSIPLTQEVIDYVTSRLGPFSTADSLLADRLTTAESGLAELDAASSAHEADLASLEATATAHALRLGAIDAAVQQVIDAGATDAEVAAALAALHIEDYLRISDAATTYAARKHTHDQAEVTGLEAALADLSARVDAATGVDMSSYATDAEVSSAITNALNGYLTQQVADNRYAAKTHTHAVADVTGLQGALDQRVTAPTSGTTGDVMTWDGTKLVLRAPATSTGGDLTKAQADTYYAAKVHAHAITDVTGLQGALDAKLTQSTADGRYALKAEASAKAITYAFSQGGTLSVKTGTSALYNDSSAARTLTHLRASVGTAPAGSPVTVALKINGTQAATVSIPAGSTTATATGTWSWPTGQALTVDITAVGSTTAGADLTVGVTGA